MSLNKKLLAGAIVGLLFSANASANVLDGTDAYVFATELVNGTDVAGLVADAPLNYNFSANEVRYGRFSCDAEVELSNITVATSSALIDLGAVNGNGTNTIFFSMTGDPTITAATPTDADTVTVTADVELLSKDDVTCEFALYDLPSQAQSGGSAGLVINSGTGGYKTWITRESGFVFAMDPNGVTQTVADVEDPAGAYFGFVGADTRFGNLTFQAVPGVWDADLADITLADIFDADSTVTVEGDMSATTGIGDDATFTIAPVDNDVATFDAFDTQGVGTMYYFETGTDPIQASEYTATLHAIANPGYEVDDIGPIHIGDILRNGTELQAPLAQLPSGWISRIALTNTGAIDRDYTISVMSEDGVTLTTDAGNLTGIVPAGSTLVVELPSVITGTDAASGNIRGTVNVNVAAPNSQIQGLYQIVNGEKGSISNHVMVRPGTN